MTRFVILSHGRTGSTALCHALSTHPDIHAYHEIFHRDPASRSSVGGRTYRDGEDAAVFCREVLYALPNEFGKATIGFKMFFFHARESDSAFSAWRYLLSDRSIRVIYLLRKNLFDCFVSEQRSRRSGLWVLQQGQKTPLSHEEPIFIEPHECRTFMERTLAEITWARAAFAQHPHMTLEHQEMQTDLDAALAKVFAFLGAEPRPIPFRFERLNTVPHEAGVANYGDLRERFRLTIFRVFFFDEEEDLTAREFGRRSS